MNRIRGWLARLTGPPGTPVRPAGQLTGLTAHPASWPGRDGLAGRLIQGVQAAASIAAGHQAGRRAAATGQSRGRTATALGWPPHTVQLCIHCRRRPAGFWVSHRGGQTVRRPWCLSCCQALDQERCHVVPFDS